MDTIALKQALKERKRIYGTLVTSYNPHVVKVLKAINIDFVFIDTEHVPLDRSQVAWMCSLFEASGIASIVRIHAQNQFEATAMLDAGASGVVVPYAEDVDIIKTIGAAVKLRPLRGEKLNAIGVYGTHAPGSELKKYLDEYNRGHIFGVNIESQPAIDRLDQILSIEYVDFLLIGPHDLSCNLEVPERYDDPKFVDAISIIIGAASKRNISCGIHYFWGIEREVELLKAGLSMLIHSSDISCFSQKLSADLNRIKQEVGDVPSEGTAEIII